jgi:hypothetical protein
MTVAVTLVGTGCSVGQGSPDGWRYLRAGQVAVAHPKTWRETASGAVLRDAHGRTDASLVIQPAGTGAGTGGQGSGADGSGGPGTRAAGSEAAGTGVGAAGSQVPPGVVPADARRDTLSLDGHRAAVYNYARPAPDGRPAAYVEVHVQGRDGRPLLIRAWAVNGVGHDRTLLPEIVNSVEFTAGKLP